MIFSLPSEQGASSYSQRVTLDGSTYNLEFNWNGRAGAWYMSIYAEDGAPLLLSRKLSTNCPLLKKYRFVDGLPPGELMATDPSNSIDYAGYEELGPGRGVVLYYFDAEFLATGA